MATASPTGKKGFGFLCSGMMTERDARNLRIFNGWVIAWTLCFAVSTLVIGSMKVSGATGWSLATATVVLGLMTIVSFMRFLREADELLRKIQTEALGLGFGAGAFFMLTYRLFERLGAPKLDSVDPLLVMVLFWAAGQWMGLRKYGAAEDGE